MAYRKSKSQASQPTEVRAAIYLRISDDPRNEQVGVDRQERLCVKLAADKGCQVAGIYRDNDKSAYDLTIRRVEYERMVADIKAGRVNAIVAYSGDRIHRRLLKLTELIHVLEEYRVQVATVTTGVMDLTTAPGRMMAMQWGLLAEYESAIKSERVTAAMADIAAKGGWHGGQRPFGYEADGLTIIPAERDEVRRWAADVLAGKPLRQIAEESTARGMRSPERTRRNGRTMAGKPFSYSVIAGILKQPRTAGRRQWQGEDIGEAQWEGLLDLDTWQAVRLILEAPERKHARSAEYLLTGLLYSPAHPDGSCSEDGYCLHPAEKLRGGRASNRGNARIYHAPGARIGADVADEAITDAALAVADEARIKPQPGAVSAAVRAEVARIRAEIAELQEAHQSRLINASQLVQGLAPLNKELEAAEAQMAAETAATRRTAHAWLNRPGALRKLWAGKAFTTERKREALSELLEYVVVMPQRGPKFQPSRLRYKWRGEAQPAARAA